MIGPVGRHSFARPHQQAVARFERGNRNDHDLSTGLEPVRGLSLQRSEIAGDCPGLAPHCVIDIAAAQQKKQQHDGGIEIRMLRMVRRLDDRHADRQQHGERNRYIHVELPCAKRAQRTHEERPARVGYGRQRDERRKPMKEIARLRRHVAGAAGPYRNRQQHDVHGCKARDRKAFHQQPRLARFVGFRAIRLEGMGAVTDPIEHADDVAGLERTLLPADGEPAVREVEARIDDAGHLQQTVLDLADATRAVHAVYG